MGKTVRSSLEHIRLRKSLSRQKVISALPDTEIGKIIDEDPDLYHLSDEELAQFTLVKENRNDQA